ncbi:MAG: UBC-like protein [Terrestrivirus sp.]|uniref:E2 ubiquitin-conjugating enzyme n=1 Tax=Terrestrivirus sp. TaxID=2487775 RepID=A0A3G4ZP93_9VIRU|nr:MAG: UBC-like protein [Terrestrivirus sp.]
MSKILYEVYESAFKDPFEGNMNIRVCFDFSTNILYVEYTGHNDSEYKNGQYFISFELPNNFPKAPPKIRFLTPSGRFNVNYPISMSISDMHTESWYGMNLYSCVCTVISAFQDDNITGVGHITESKENRLKYAKYSRQYNQVNNKELCQIFHEHGFPLYEQIKLGQEYKRLRSIDDNKLTDDDKIQLKLVKQEINEELDLLADHFKQISKKFEF